MKSFYAPIILAIVGGVIYQVSQKSIPQTVHPFAAIIVAYVTGIVLCGIGLLIDPAVRSWASSLTGTNWAVIGVGVGATTVEIGFLLAYRTGWNLNAASVVMSISLSLLLIPIGLLAFKEHLTLRAAAGIGCCLLGLYLLSKR